MATEKWESCWSSAAEQGDEVLAALDRDNLGRQPSPRQWTWSSTFPVPETLDAVSAYIRRTGTPLLSGTTGYTPEQLEKLRALGDCAPVLYAANYSLGIAVFQRVLSQISDTLKPEFDIEIEETHHNSKADAPSGTAKLLLSAIDPAGEYAPVYGREGNTGKRAKKEIGIHVPCGVAPLQEPTRSTFLVWTRSWRSHIGPPAARFVSGALHAARLLAGRPRGF